MPTLPNGLEAFDNDDPLLFNDAVKRKLNRNLGKLPVKHHSGSNMQVSEFPIGHWTHSSTGGGGTTVVSSDGGVAPVLTDCYVELFELVSAECNTEGKIEFVFKEDPTPFPVFCGPKPDPDPPQ